MRMVHTSGEANRSTATKQLLTDRFRYAEEFGGEFSLGEDLSSESGYFRFGPDAICYGQYSSGAPARLVTDPLRDAFDHVTVNGSSFRLPFDAAQVVDNLRHEAYHNSAQSSRTITTKGIVRNMYYLGRPLMPIGVRKHLQRLYFRGWEKLPFPKWPVDSTVENILEQLLVLSMKSAKVTRIPFIWFWPDGVPSCTLVTHDVETSVGRDFCPQLMDLNDSFGVKAAFQIVPQGRYSIPQPLLDSIRSRGFELNVHDLNHDGHLMRDRDEFLRRVGQINRHALRFGALGFRSAMLYRNVDWYDALDFSYDLSVPNVAHLDPQRGGCCTVFPYFIGKILELPVTMTQDYSLFHILRAYSLTLWKQQISLIRKKYGLIHLIVHPDYVIDDAARRVYSELLGYLSELRSQGETWIALPNEVNTWWRLRSQLSLVNTGDSLHIEGEGNQRARIAYATIADGTLKYEFGSTP